MHVKWGLWPTMCARPWPTAGAQPARRNQQKNSLGHITRPRPSNPRSRLGPIGHPSCCPLPTRRPNPITGHWRHRAAASSGRLPRASQHLHCLPKCPSLKLAGRAINATCCTDSSGTATIHMKYRQATSEPTGLPSSNRTWPLVPAKRPTLPFHLRGTRPAGLNISFPCQEEGDAVPLCIPVQVPPPPPELLRLDPGSWGTMGTRPPNSGLAEGRVGSGASLPSAQREQTGGKKVGVEAQPRPTSQG